MEGLTNLEKELRLIGKEEFSIGDYQFFYEVGKGTYYVTGKLGNLGY